jgi:hypothetical protein
MSYHDKDIYNHFSHQWVSPEQLHRREFTNTIKGIGAGILVSLLMALMTLTVILGIWG